MDVQKYDFKVSYTDNREGRLSWAVVSAEDEDEAFNLALEEDYYFGQLTGIECLGPTSDKGK